MIISIDIRAFETLFRQHFKFLCVLAFQYIRDEEISKDLVQDFFTDLWQRRNNLNIISSFQTYASCAIKYKCITYLNAEKRSKVLLDQGISEFDTRSEPIIWMEEGWNKKEETDFQVMQLVNMMPTKRRSIFLLFVVDNLSYSEIAKQKEISINTVKTQMKRAYAFLKKHGKADAMSVVIISILLSEMN